MTPPNDPQSAQLPPAAVPAALVAEQLGRTLDRVRGELSLLAERQQSADKLSEMRLAALEARASDYEARLRALQESAVQFKLLASLATGGGLLSILALLKALSGR